MTLRKAWPALLVVAVLALGGAAAVRTVVNSGLAAVAQMNADERVLLTKLEMLRNGMSPCELNLLLNPDASPAAHPRHPLRAG